MNIIFLFLCAFIDNKLVISTQLNKPKHLNLPLAVTQLTKPLSDQSKLFVIHDGDKKLNDNNEDKSDLKKTYDTNYSTSADSENYEDQTMFEEEFLENKQINNKKEYEDIGLEETLDNMENGKNEATNALPVFLEEPQNTFIVKNRAATLTCKAAYALQISFKCSGRSQSPPSIYEHHVDPHTGIHLQEVTATISRDLVDEYFGNNPFQCECQAWSPRGVSKSQSARITVAFIKKTFSVSSTSIRTELSTRVELECNAPAGMPIPRLSWLKNGQSLQSDSRIDITSEGSLLIASTNGQDTGNYTCVAENIAGKRISPEIELTVYVNGGWSKWGPWVECSCLAKFVQGQKRSRTCTNPEPLNTGIFCKGPSIQKTHDCTVCNGRWSNWSEWSTCSNNCTQSKKRFCEMKLTSNITAETDCIGKSVQIVECRGGECDINKNDKMWLLYMGIAAFVCVFLIIFGKCCGKNKRSNNHYPSYSLTQTDVQSEYFAENNKKSSAFKPDLTHNRSSTYEYPTNCHVTMHDINNSHCEPHYDIPHLSNTYIAPLDKISIHTNNSSLHYTKKNYSIDSSTATSITPDSAYYAISEPSTIPISSELKMEKMMSSCGGIITMDKYNVALLIPEQKVNSTNKKKSFLITLLKNENFEGNACVISPFVLVYEMEYSRLSRPAIIKIPHCMVDLKRWKVSVYYSKYINEAAGNSSHQVPVWQKIVTIGEEDINTPIFVQLESKYANISTEVLGKFVLVASSLDPQTSPACKSMKLLLFAMVDHNTNSIQARVYIVNNLFGCTENCIEFERSLGTQLLGQKDFLLFDSEKDLVVQLECMNGEHLSNCQTNIVPSALTWNNTSNKLLHCDFRIEQSENLPQLAACMSIKVIAFQEHDDDKTTIYSINPLEMYENVKMSEVDGKQDRFFVNNKHRDLSTIRSKHLIVNQLQSVSTCSSSNLSLELMTTNSANFSNFAFSLSPVVRKQICLKLDPPTEKGNDWRLFAHHLNIDRYLPYFASRASPTNLILDFWELRNWNGELENSSQDLIHILISMNREDVAAIIENIKTPTWI